jgi:hypothetical protein
MEHVVLPSSNFADMLLFVIGVGTTDGRYYNEGVALYTQLRKLGIRTHLLTTMGGHSWLLWAQQLGETLPLIESSHAIVHNYLFIRNTAAISFLVNSSSLYYYRPADGSVIKLVRKEKSCSF